MKAILCPVKSSLDSTHQSSVVDTQRCWQVVHYCGVKKIYPWGNRWVLILTEYHLHSLHSPLPLGLPPPVVQDLTLPLDHPPSPKEKPSTTYPERLPKENPHPEPVSGRVLVFTRTHISSPLVITQKQRPWHDPKRTEQHTPTTITPPWRVPTQWTRSMTHWFLFGDHPTHLSYFPHTGVKGPVRRRVAKDHRFFLFFQKALYVHTWYTRWTKRDP